MRDALRRHSMSASPHSRSSLLARYASRGAQCSQRAARRAWPLRLLASVAATASSATTVAPAAHCAPARGADRVRPRPAHRERHGPRDLPARSTATRITSIRDDDSLILDQAASVEQPDRTTIIIKLRGDAVPGRRAGERTRHRVAADVAASIERYRDNPLVVEQDVAHDRSSIASRQPDDRTVVVRTKRPYAYSLHELGAIGAGAIIPRELVAREHRPQRLRRLGAARSARRGVRSRGAHASAATTATSGRRFPTSTRWSGRCTTATTRRSMRSSPATRRKSQTATAPSTSSVLSASGDRPGVGRAGAQLSLARDCASTGRRSTTRACARRSTWRSTATTLIREMVGGDGDVLGPVNWHLAGGFWSLTRGRGCRGTGRHHAA